MAAQTINIHATCLLVDRAGAAFGAPRDAGVLILGKSGAGKSDLALKLIARGMRLVCDDRCELFVTRGKLFGRSPKSLAGLLEVRGVGIVKLPQAAKARIELVVELAERIARLPVHGRYKPALALPAAARPPLLKIMPFEGSAPDKVVLAAAAFASGLFREDVNTR